MHTAKFKRYRPLYRSVLAMEADKILRRHLGIADDYPLPLSLSHGVDFGQCRPSLDIDAVEPIHWAYNKFIYASAQPFKPAVKIPHPLLLLPARTPAAAERGTLVIGPPPGPLNDQRLLERLGQRKDATILVKPKRGYQQSMRFWCQQGFGAVSLAEHGGTTYERLVDLFGKYEQIVGCTLSSGLVFAAAIGKSVELLDDYTYRAYETSAVDDVFVWDADRPAALVSLLVSGRGRDAAVMCRQLLGSELDFDPRCIVMALEQAMANLDEPIWFGAHYPRPLRILLREAALWFRREDLIRIPLARLVERRRDPVIYEMEINEISMWLHGRNENNVNLRTVPFVLGHTVAGEAVEQYSS